VRLANTQFDSLGGPKLWCNDDAIRIGGRELHRCMENQTSATSERALQAALGDKDAPMPKEEEPIRERPHAPAELGTDCRGSRSVVFVAADLQTPSATAKQLRTRSELAAYIGIDSPPAAQQYALLTSPSFDESFEALKASAKGTGPYDVTLFEKQVCGCEHPVFRVTLRVTQTGAIKELNRVKVFGTPAPKGANVVEACVD
jgi:hypothetical protein